MFELCWNLCEYFLPQHVLFSWAMMTKCYHHKFFFSEFQKGMVSSFQVFFFLNSSSLNSKMVWCQVFLFFFWWNAFSLFQPCPYDNDSLPTLEFFVLKQNFLTVNKTTLIFRRFLSCTWLLFDTSLYKTKLFIGFLYFVLSFWQWIEQELGFVELS